ncbi:dirigent protein 22-like [Gastrolobium bilobum]|uniref:dirigent protein 22-like n=1 Tax=Gastrolobium bilobum TaxID=150636 RepID=UPI002AB308E1|nr:dirigent protein 22-like [Gastrolobium bilobum]
MACDILRFFFLFSCYLISIHGVPLEESHIILPTERPERVTHLHFYFHDILDGENRTSVKIINPPSGSPSAFGATYMIDNPLTEEQDLSSKLIGRAQGTYALASQQLDFAFKMDINFVFTEGTYNGSTLTMLGRNVITQEVREMPIVGGTGVFRFARGYALAKTVWYNTTSGNAIEEFNVRLTH